MEEKLYTLAEAKKLLDEAKKLLDEKEKREYCSYHGHDWETTSNMAGEIVFITCSNNCGQEPVFAPGFDPTISHRYAGPVNTSNITDWD